MDDSTIAIRIGVAALLAAVLGVEREWKHQSAGFRTHILVSVGSCLYTLVGAYAFNGIAGAGSGSIRVDVSRVASQIVVGIGFLGGGSILKSGLTVRGLTTAANLWVAAGVGMAVGAGYYFAAAVTAGVVLLALAGLRPLEKRVFGDDAARDDARTFPKDKSVD